jgi:guanylate kinase
VRELLKVCKLPLALSVSATTRQPRRGEVEGVDYYFLTPEQFAARRETGDFLECKEYAGNWYGTLQDQVSAGLAGGKWVILEIDVEGTLAVLQKHPEALTIFVHSGSVEELERRLRLRNTESEEALARRLAAARRELAQQHRYRYQIINRDVPQAVREVCEVLERHAKESPCSTH